MALQKSIVQVLLPSDPAGALQTATEQYADTKVASVTAANSTITVAGTTTAPTVAVGALAESNVTNLTTDLAAKAPTSRTLAAGTGLTGGGDLSADRTFTVAYGTSGTTACVGNDSRLSDSRAPTAHKSTHATGGSDVLSPADIGAQPVDSDLTTIAGLTATTDNFMVAAASAWASRTPAQAKTSLAITESDVSGLVTDLAAKVPLSVLTAKGDVLAATGSGAVDNLAVGSDGQVLTADSAQTTGVKWATAAGGDPVQSYLLSGFDLVAASVHPDSIGPGSISLGKNTIFVARVYVPANTLITGGATYLNGGGVTPGATGASGFVLFSDTGTQKAVTANDYTIFTAAGWRSKAFTSPYTTGSVGEWLRVGMVPTCTTAPTALTSNTFLAGIVTTSRSGTTVRRAVSQTSATTFPASITPTTYGTVLTFWPFICLY